MTTVEAQARRYLQLFPTWMRADRGEEAVGLVLDLLPPGADRLPLRARVDLVRAGLHARRVGIPPVRVLWRVLMATPRSPGRPVPPSWRPWLASWLRSPRWRQRYAAACVAPVAVLLVAVAAGTLAAGSQPDPLVWPTCWVLVAASQGWRGAPRWRQVVSVTNALDPVTLGELPDGARVPVVLPPSVRDGRAIARIDALLVGCALVLVAQVGLLAVGRGPFGRSWSVGLVLGGGLWAAIIAGAGAGVVATAARRLATLPPPKGDGTPLVAPVTEPDGVRAAHWILCVIAALFVALLGPVGAGAVVVTAACTLVARHRVRRAEAITGHPLTVWGLFPSLGPSVRWLVPAGEGRWGGPAPA